MTTSNPKLPVELTTEFIIDHYELCFDGGDAANGSLYVGVPRGDDEPLNALAELRQAALWSSDPLKRIGDEQRDAYKAGLVFVDCAIYRNNGVHLVLARFDHPKFPSNGDRWNAWLKLFDGFYERER